MTHKFYKEDMRKGEYTLETEQLKPMLLEWLFTKDTAFIAIFIDSADTRGLISHFILEKSGLDSYMDDDRPLYLELRNIVVDYEASAHQLQKYFISTLISKLPDECSVWQQAIKANMKDSAKIGALIKSLIGSYATDTMREELGGYACDILENIYKLKL